MQEAIQERILRRVSCRDYERVLEDICDGCGIDKSSVSRHWKAASIRQLQQVLQRRLENLDLAVLLLDGKRFYKFTLIVALGVDFAGRKHVLGLWAGDTENAEVCGQLLDELIERGLAVDKNYLFILDGSKALKKAVKKRFGRHGLIQRCRLHKERNIQSHLPKHYHRLLRMKLQTAWNMTDYAEALAELRKVHDWLATINIAAAHSLEEGLEETLTVNKLKLSPVLRKLFCTTNMIESSLSLADDLCRNVKHWRDANMAWRWCGSALLEAEKRFHRIHGYRELPLLIQALEKGVDEKQKVA